VIERNGRHEETRTPDLHRVNDLQDRGDWQQLMRDGKTEEALAIYRQTLQTSPNSVPANIAAGSVLDLMGKGDEARQYFTKAIDVADTPGGTASAKRAMAMSFAFEGNCNKTIEYEQQVFDFYGSAKNFFQQGVILAHFKLGHGKIRAQLDCPLKILQVCVALLVRNLGAKAVSFQGVKRRRAGIRHWKIKFLHGSQRLSQFTA
jgi:tetratricopeptide (TPR) repeat protein